MIRKAGKMSNIPKLSGRDDLVDLLSDKQRNNKHNTNKEDQLRVREEAKHKLLELCIAMEGTTFVSKVMAKNILQAAQELHDSF